MATHKFPIWLTKSQSQSRNYLRHCKFAAFLWGWIGRQWQHKAGRLSQVAGFSHHDNGGFSFSKFLIPMSFSLLTHLLEFLAMITTKFRTMSFAWLILYSICPVLLFLHLCHVHPFQKGWLTFPSGRCFPHDICVFFLCVQIFHSCVFLHSWFFIILISLLF